MLSAEFRKRYSRVFKFFQHFFPPLRKHFLSFIAVESFFLLKNSRNAIIHSRSLFRSVFFRGGLDGKFQRCKRDEQKVAQFVYNVVLQNGILPSSGSALYSNFTSTFIHPTELLKVFSATKLDASPL